MNWMTVSYYVGLLWAIQEIDIDEDPETAEEALDIYHLAAADYLRENYDSDIMDSVNMDGDVEDLALRLVKALSFDSSEDPEEIKAKAGDILGVDP